MRRRPRFWAWTLTLTAALLAVVWVGSMKVWAGVSTSQRRLSFASGTIRYVCFVGVDRPLNPGAWMDEGEDWQASWWFDYGEAALRSMSPGSIGGKTVYWSIPLWSFVLLTGVPGVWMLVKTRKHTNPHACPACGYDRTGLPQSSTGPAPCPECGKGAEPTHVQ